MLARILPLHERDARAYIVLVESTPEPRSRFSLKGKTGLIVAVAVVAILLIALPAYRWFFLISVAVGVGVAAILYFWHKLRPIKDEEVEHKRPLGLD